MPDFPPAFQVGSGGRVVQPRPALIPGRAQFQDRAVAFQDAVRLGGQVNGLIRSAAQDAPVQRRAVVAAAGGVEPPVFGDAHGGVDGRLAPHVGQGRAFRRHFQRPVGRLAHFPGQVNLAGSDGPGVHPEGQVDVRRNPHVQVAGVIANVGFVVQKHVGAPVEVGKTRLEQPEEFRHFEILFHSVRGQVLGVGIKFQAGVVDLALAVVGQHFGFICGGGHCKPPSGLLAPILAPKNAGGVMPPAPAFSSSPSPRLASYSSPLLDGSGRLDLFHQVVVPVALGDEDSLGII